MKRKHVHRIIWVGVFIAAVCAGRGDALAGSGYSQGGAFKSPGYGARAWGMGGAAVATVGDESSIYWNPAMMARANSPIVGASYINLVAGTKAQQSQIAYLHVLKKSRPDHKGATMARHALGALYTNLRLGIQSGEGYDENILRLAYSYTPDYFVSFAVAADLLHSSSDVSGYKSKGTSIDLGLRFIVTKHTTLGIVARNAFSRYSYLDGADFRREREFAIGLSVDAIPHVTAEADAVIAHGKPSRWILGAESDYLFDVLALRAGFAVIKAGESRNVPYVGFGVNFNRLTLHYNANLDTENAFADTHRFTLSVEL
jgi:hypothetical protein